MAYHPLLSSSQSMEASEGAWGVEGLVWGHGTSAQVYGASMATIEPDRTDLTICKVAGHGSQVLSAPRLVRKELIESELWVRKG